MNTNCTPPTTYPADLTDVEWTVVAPFVKTDLGIGSPRAVWMRCVVHTLCYLHTMVCQWQLVPSDLPNSGTVDYHFRRWTENGSVECINTELRQLLRTRSGRDPEPRLAIVDSQRVKTTERAAMLGMMRTSRWMAANAIAWSTRLACCSWSVGRLRRCKIPERAVPGATSARHVSARAELWSS